MNSLHQFNKMDQTSESEKQYQGQIYEDIKQRLINAGYFRARIRFIIKKIIALVTMRHYANLNVVLFYCNSNLSDFDRVVGGLCWCITSSGV